jgi:hypothetical protein
MKSIIQLIQTAIHSDQNKFLGRWNITYCKSTINKKIDLANEDNCGTCYSTKYHNDSYITHINNIKHVKPDNIINSRRYITYINNINYIKYIKNSSKFYVKNPIIDLE